MKNGSGSASAPSAGGNSLAIAERQKPAPSCVAALFQMFAKRKLFSSSSKKSKMLPQVRAQKFSPGRPPGGGEKTSAAKTRPLLLDSADYSRSKSEGNGTSRYPQPGQERNCSENEMCTPGVVARLMGLSSMPAVSHQRPTKATDSSEPGDHRNSGPPNWSGTSQSIYTSPQKQQKTGQFTDDRRHESAIQFNSPDTRSLWPRRHAHKVASPVKSPRSLSNRNKARLIEAAAKVLEPGLQSRNRRLSRRHAYLEYSCDGVDDAPGAAAVVHNLSDQFLRETCDIDAPGVGAHNIGVTSLHNSTSNQWTEEDSSRGISVRSDKNVSCQMQPERNGKCLLVSSSKKAGFGDSVQGDTNRIAVTNQDVRKNQLRNISRGSVPCGPLKQNNLKQNALPVACRAADPGYIVQRHKHRSGERNPTNTAQDFVSLNKRMTGSTSLRSKRKVMDRFGESHTSAENKNMSTKGRQTSSLHSDNSNKLKLKTATPKAMEKDMIIAKGAGLVSEKPKSASPNYARSGLQRQAVPRNISRCNKKSDIISFTFSSPIKIAPTSLPGDNATGTGSAVQGSPVGTCSKRHPRRDCQNMSPQREVVFREVLQGTSCLETAESVFFNQDESKNRYISGGRAASSLFEKISAVPVTEESLSDELLRQCNSDDSVIDGFRDPYKAVQLREAHRKHEADAKGTHPSPSISRGSNKRSPTSILHSTYADDAFISGIPLSAAEAAFTDSHPMETCTAAASMQDVTTERSSRCSEPNFGQHGAQPFEPAVQGSKLTPGEVRTTVELLLTHVCSSSRRKSKGSSKTFLRQTIESALATLTTSAKQDFNTIKGTEATPLRNLALDFVLECLDSMCVQLSGSGYRSFSKIALICTEERLAAEVKKEIARCSDMAGRGLDDLAVSDVEHAVEAGMNFMLEAFQIGAQIEQDLVQELVNEIGLDMSKRL
ncbi:uncharacterized protein LOC133884795 [Phragmites australis]|uniref:uncharacterized protein LOC133884795 n=1 Tax=Phragmites australis TaxID=29695 RepID=UPI002D78FCBA|nr:uncharacterized protein LOC133884795 [Phragmites australis]